MADGSSTAYDVWTQESSCLAAAVRCLLASSCLLSDAVGLCRSSPIPNGTVRALLLLTYFTCLLIFAHIKIASHSI
jgi:hypothetical protein